MEKPKDSDHKLQSCRYVAKSYVGFNRTLKVYITHTHSCRELNAFVMTKWQHNCDRSWGNCPLAILFMWICITQYWAVWLMEIPSMYGYWLTVRKCNVNKTVNKVFMLISDIQRLCISTSCHCKTGIPPLRKHGL